jgi:hypothetical protein
VAHKVISYTELHENPLTIHELSLTKYEFSGFIEDGTIGMKNTICLLALKNTPCSCIGNRL